MLLELNYYTNIFLRKRCRFINLFLKRYCWYGYNQYKKFTNAAWLYKNWRNRFRIFFYNYSLNSCCFHK